MAKTTVNLDDDLLRAAKKQAVDEGTTLGRLIERGLELAMRERTAPLAHDGALRLRTFHGNGNLSVNVADRAAMYDALDDAP